MLSQSMPSFFFPTTVLMIDDNVEFLKSIAISLIPEKATYSFYSDPKLALDLINNRFSTNHITRSLVSFLDEEELEHKRLDINARDLYRIAFNPDRFKQISTVVVDFHMPGIDGIEFCKSIKNPHIQKVLLTSIVDEHKAIEVLNQGIIHAFIRKQSANLIDQLNQTIHQSQARFFQRLSTIFHETASLSSDDNALFDEVFHKLFKSAKRDCHAVEHYLTEFQGSFLFLDAMGQRFNFFTRNREQLDFFIECKQAKTASPEVLKSLSSGEKILCLPPEIGLNLPEGHAWEPFMLDAVFVKGEKAEYYCALGPKMPPLNAPFISFSDYSSPLGLSIDS